MKVTHSETTFTMTGQHWSGTYSLGELHKWLNFYKRLREDFPKSGSSYDSSIDELEALSKSLTSHVL